MNAMPAPQRVSNFTIVLDEVDGVIVLKAVGEIDLDAAPTLVEALDRIEPERHVVLDMSGVSFMDSTGLSIIIRQSVDKRAAGGLLRLRDPAANVLRLLEFCCLEHLVETNHTCSEWS